MDHSSRRAFLASGIALSTAQSLSSQSTLTADEAIDAIRRNIGVPWRDQTVDHIVLGNGSSPVKGIATTMMATFDVVKRCVGAGLNLIVSHETPVYMHQDDIQPIAKDAAYLAKKEYCEKNQAVVFHFHDHWHARRPDGIATGMVRELGWEKHADPENPRFFKFPGTPLGQFARDMQAKLNARTMRVVGDPKMPVNRVTASWGYMSSVPLAARSQAEVLVVGETREWEVVEYIQDCIAAGQKKALVIIGHVVSEQAGMKLCADWLKTLLKDIPVEFVAAPEPYWNPGT